MESTGWENIAPLVETKAYPLHEQLRQSIQGKIDTGVLQPGDIIPPETELARIYGVSRSTARQALSNLTNAGLLHRVPGQGTFVLRRQPQNRQTVTLVCPFLNWYMPQLISGIEKSLSDAGYSLLIRNSQKDTRMEAEHIQEALNLGSAGLILWPKSPEYALEPTKAVQRALSGSIPVVLVDQYLDGVDTVTSDHFGGAYQLAEYLLEQGYRRLGFVTHHQALTSSVERRWRGLREAVLNAGLHYDTTLLFNHWPDTTLFQAWLDEAKPDAILCGNDLTAVELTSLITSIGKQVPRDLAVAGYDDIPLAATLHPSLTTVRQDFYAIGQSAARLLLEQITGTNRAPVHLTLPVHLRVRASCQRPESKQLQS